MPHYIIDGQAGYVFELQLALPEMPININKKSEMIAFLFRRVNSKLVLVKRVKKLAEVKEGLHNIQPIFNLLNTYYKYKLQYVFIIQLTWQGNKPYPNLQTMMILMPTF